MILFLILLLLNDLIRYSEHYPVILFAKVVKLACNRTYS